MIGMIATATAAAMVAMLIDQARAGSDGFSATAIAPATTRRPIATASAMMNPTTLLRRRSSNPDLAFWSDIGTVFEKLKSLSAVIGMKLPANVGIGEGSSQYIRGLESGRGSELPKKRSPAPGRFTMSLGEVKRAVLRYCKY